MSRAVVLLALAAAACATGRGPAPISYGGAGQPASSTQRAPPQTILQAPVIAAPAPTPQADWAVETGPSLADFALRREDVQPYDAARTPRTHQVSADESLYDIATRFQIPLRALIDQNRLEPPYALAPGRTIELPPPRLHRVAGDERLEDIARAHNVDLRSLALLNRKPAPYDLRVGEEIVLPALARPWTNATPAPSPAMEPPARAAVEAPFQWPLRGEVLTRFGPQPGGARSDGIEIAAAEGDPIAAAADGDVVYAGSDLPGYGTLVLVRHASGYVTAYGYGRRALAREGDAVRAGQAIAEVGPRDGRPRLLFQVRRGREAVDPQLLLR